MATLTKAPMLPVKATPLHLFVKMGRFKACELAMKGGILEQRRNWTIDAYQLWHQALYGDSPSTESAYRLAGWIMKYHDPHVS